MSAPWALAIDFGTSRSSGAMLADTSVQALEVEGNRWIASMVLLDQDGTLLVGSAADNQAGVYPDRVERTPKRHIGSAAPLLLGGEPVEVPRAVAAVLQVFLKEGRLRRSGEAPGAVVLTHPVRWEDTRKQALARAADLAGLPEPMLLEEPVAAALHYAADQVAEGEYVAVYDLGGGTFDTAVLQRTGDAFEVVGAPGGDEAIGGEHFDHKLFRHFGEILAGDDAELWEQILTGDERKWKRAAADLLVQARRAKEALSSYPSTEVFVPIAERDIVVTRAQFEDMIRDEIERTVDVMDDTIFSAGLTHDEVAAIYLVGGSSRLPLVVRTMTERFGDKITTRDEPKSVVVLGAARLAAVPLRGGGGDAEPLPAPAPAPELAVAAGAPAEIAANAEPVATSPVATSPAAHAPADDVPVLAVDSSVLPPDPDVVWRVDLPARPGYGVAVDDLFVVPTLDGAVFGIALETGETRWSADLGGPAYAAPAARDGVCYAIRGDGVLLAFEAATGALRWQVTIGGPAYAPPVVLDHLVLVANDSGSLFALERNNGGVYWHLPVGSAIRTGLVPAPPFHVFGTADGRVLAIEAATGVTRWVYPTGGAITGAPAVAGGAALVPSGDGMLYSLDCATGVARWAFRTGGAITSPTALFGELVLGGSADGNVYALDAVTGAAAWRLPTAGAVDPGPVTDDGVVYVDGGDAHLRAVDVGTRALRWRISTGGGHWTRPALAPDLVLVGTAHPRLVAIRSVRTAPPC